MKKLGIMFGTELKLALRSFDGVFFGMIMPLVILLVVGWIFKGKNLETQGYIVDQTIGAFAFIGIGAYGLMSLPLVLADYRNKKILKRLQVTPVSPLTLLLVQVAVQALMAVVSALVVLFTGWLIFHVKSSGSFLPIIFSYLLGLGAVFSIGLTVASVARDEKKAGIWCSMLYFPMLLLSGTTIPFPVLPEVLQKIAVVSPLRHGIQLMNGAFHGFPLGMFLLEILILSAVMVLGLAVSLATFRWDYDS